MTPSTSVGTPTFEVGAYDDYYAMHWFYTEEGPNAAFAGQLTEKYGGGVNGSTLLAAEPPTRRDAFFYNEQIVTEARHYTEFFLPDRSDPLPDAELGVAAV